jgi:hypothetical protein
VRELRSIERVREKRDGVGRRVRERAYASDDDVGIAVELTPEVGRELT